MVGYHRLIFAGMPGARTELSGSVLMTRMLHDRRSSLVITSVVLVYVLASGRLCMLKQVGCDKLPVRSELKFSRTNCLLHSRSLRGSRTPREVYTEYIVSYPSLIKLCRT